MRRIISLLVENEHGLLSRSAGLLSARGNKIAILTLAPADEHSILSCPIFTNVSEQLIDRYTNQRH